uniref:Uncharacterized LOC107321278 n=1 Tax=Coturnix japonica TaxID=93934 RepID=A0A8C2U1W9_COTJA
MEFQHSTRHDSSRDYSFYQVSHAFSLPLIQCPGLFLGLEEAVKCESITEAPLGQEANFSCDFLLRMNVFQVTWQKINGSSVWNIATYSQTHGLRLQESFQRKARLTVAALNTSAITLQNLTSEDTSCYRCIFNVFPHGSFSSPDLCLKIQKSGNANRTEVNMLVISSPSTRGISGTQKRIDLVVFFIGAVLGTLILLITWLIKRRRRKLQMPRPLSTPEKEKGLQEDVCEQSVSLKTPKVQGSAYQNERQTPGSSHHKRLLNPRRNLEGNTERETGKQDVSELSSSQKTPKVQGSAHLNERQTPGSSLRKRLLNPRRNREENKERESWNRKRRLPTSEEAGSQGKYA